MATRNRQPRKQKPGIKYEMNLMELLNAEHVTYQELVS